MNRLLAIIVALLCSHALAAESLLGKKTGDRELRLHIEKPAGWTAADRRHLGSAKILGGVGKGLAKAMAELKQLKQAK